MTWLFFGLGLIAVPANWFFIQLLRWAFSHRVGETPAQTAVWLAVLGLIVVIAGGAILAMIRRWRRTVLGLSVLQLVPSVLVLAVSAVGAL